MSSAIWQIIVKLVDTNKIGGWTRALVAALLTMLLAQWPPLAAIVTPDLQAAIAIAISSAIVGVWSQIAKSMANA